MDIKFYLPLRYDSETKQFQAEMYTNVAENVFLNIESEESIADTLMQLQNAIDAHNTQLQSINNTINNIDTTYDIISIAEATGGTETVPRVVNAFNLKQIISDISKENIGIQEVGNEETPLDEAYITKIFGDLIGNADTATKLKNPVNINGMPFDGSEDIEISSSSSSDGLPPGTIITYSATSIPEGYLKCNGASISRETYADLFAAIGTTYGGSGSNFTLPDLRGEFIRGWTDGRSNVDAGRTFGSSQTDSFQGHWHFNRSNFDYLTSGSTWGVVQGSNSDPRTSYSQTAGTIAASYGTPRIAAETRPRNIALQFLIKY